jgi:hypothetical protein
MNYADFYDNGYKIFGLYGINKNGQCECLSPKCTAAGKHPLTSNWQSTPVWDNDQLECMEEMGSFDSGYGVLCDGLLVIDVDEKNGGAPNYQKLLKVIPNVGLSGLIVRTGSGGASRHIFFKIPVNTKLQQQHKDYKGIDFKSSGFVVGAGSIHKSGNKYEIVSGQVDEINEAPRELIELLSRKQVTSNFGENEINDGELIEMLNFVNADCAHDKWIRIGMAIHNCTSGTGFEIWDSWSAKGKKYDGSEKLSARWHSFGKSANPVKLGTLLHYAIEDGYEQDVKFISDIKFEEEKTEFEKTEFEKIDLTKPPGLVGKITQYINNCSRSPRLNLAVAAALQAVSSAGGLRFRCAEDGTVGNMFSFCVAGSGTGKEAILQSYISLMREAGVVGAAHGGIKSEQEIYKNIIRNQAAFYTIDEMGEMLGKIQGARKKSGSSPYLEGVIGVLMSIYSKGNGYMLVNGDVKEEIRSKMLMELKAIEISIKNNEADNGATNRTQQLTGALKNIDNGIKNPFLNLFGFSSPDKFLALMDDDMAQSGFFARALIFRDLDDNPQDNKNMHKDEEELQRLGLILSSLYHAGHTASGRVELLGKIELIKSTEKAKSMMKLAKDFFWEMGENQKYKDGLVAYTRRGYELVSRVSLVLAMQEGVRTDEHVKWAFALIKRDIEDKIKLTTANSTTNKADAITSKILSLVSEDEGLTLRIIKNKLRPNKAEIVEAAITHLVETTKELIAKDIKIRGQETTQYFRSLSYN